MIDGVSRFETRYLFPRDTHTHTATGTHSNTHTNSNTQMNPIYTHTPHSDIKIYTHLTLD